jgi:hypothetical protein
VCQMPAPVSVQQTWQRNGTVGHKRCSCAKCRQLASRVFQSDPSPSSQGTPQRSRHAAPAAAQGGTCERGEGRKGEEEGGQSGKRRGINI